MQPGALNISFTRGDDFSLLLAFLGPPTGSTGNTVLYGTTAPAASLGSDGDYYIDATTAVGYGPKTAGDWGISSPLPPLDLTGRTFTAQVREFEDASAVAAEITVDDSDGVNGNLWLRIGHLVTETLEREYVWDLQMVDVDTTITTVLRGNASAHPDVTRVTV